MSTAKQWLEQNGYADILKKIERVERGWKAKGTRTRRDWWEVLAGHEDGTPKSVEGVKFPVLCAARKRMGLPAIDGCLSRDPNEEAPPVVGQARWEQAK